jgi:hypothetical protein
VPFKEEDPKANKVIAIDTRRDPKANKVINIDTGKDKATLPFK